MQFLSEGVETLGTPFAFVPLRKLERGRMQNSRMEEERKYMPFYACFFMWRVARMLPFIFANLACVVVSAFVIYIFICLFVVLYIYLFLISLLHANRIFEVMKRNSTSAKIKRTACSNINENRIRCSREEEMKKVMVNAIRSKQNAEKFLVAAGILDETGQNFSSHLNKYK